MVAALLANPVVAYLLGFVGLSLVLSLAIHTIDQKFVLSERTCGILALLLGAGGGMLLQATGLVFLPSKNIVLNFGTAAFVGALASAAAAGFSNVDLRRVFVAKGE